MKEKISLFFLSLTAERVENHEKSFFLSVSNKIITVSETSQIIAIILHFQISKFVFLSTKRSSQTHTFMITKNKERMTGGKKNQTQFHKKMVKKTNKNTSD